MGNGDLVLGKIQTADKQLTWGEIKKCMEENNVPDNTNISLVVEIEGLNPKLIASGWANSIERPSLYTVILRHDP